jgi:hypothetical protein
MAFRRLRIEKTKHEFTVPEKLLSVLGKNTVTKDDEEDEYELTPELKKEINFAILNKIYSNRWGGNKYETVKDIFENDLDFVPNLDEPMPWIFTNDSKIGDVFKDMFTVVVYDDLNHPELSEQPYAEVSFDRSGKLIDVSIDYKP